MINFDEILKGLTLILTNAVATLPQKEKDLAMGYLKGLEERFLFYLNQLEAGTLSLNDVIALLENEPQIVISQVESLGIVAGADIEGAVNDAIDLLIASIPTVTVAGETKAAFDTQSTYSKAVGVVAGDQPVSNNALYGIFTAGSLSTPDIITLAIKLGVKAIRMGINMDQWNGKNSGFQDLKDAGFDLLVNINYRTIRDEVGSRSPQPFCPTIGLESYKKKLREILTECTPTWAMCENEETNKIFHSGTAHDYVPQYSAFCEVCKDMGIKVTNGGLNNPALQILTYRWLVENNRSSTADSFYKNCMDSRTAKAAKNKGSNKDLDLKASETEYLLSYYARLGDAVNIHWYEPLIKKVGLWNMFDNSTGAATPQALLQITSYIRAVTGKDVVCNECGILNNNPDLVTSMINDFKNNKVNMVVYSSFVSENGTTDPLNNGTDLNDLGKVFVKAIK
jgi:hypothetical protein